VKWLVRSTPFLQIAVVGLAVHNDWVFATWLGVAGVGVCTFCAALTFEDWQ
jgi:hypothetical protein